MSYRGYKYRIYPSPEQEAKLRRWEGTTRFLWNLALEQWNMGLARSPRVYPSAFGQGRELTEIRKEHPWMGDVPRRIHAAVLDDLEKTWKRCFQRICRAPRFKSKSSPACGMYEAGDGVGVAQEGKDHFLKYPKLGLVRMVYHRPHEGNIVSATISREVDQWFVSYVCKLEDRDSTVRMPPKEIVGIDRGVANIIADSDGFLVPKPDWFESAMAREDWLSKRVSSKQKGSLNKKKAVARLGRKKRKSKRKKEHMLQELSKHYASTYKTIVVESLKISNMTRSAKGTEEEPGKNVAQKSGLNRSILFSGWGRFVALLKRKADSYGSVVVEVNAAYSSQECSKCGHIEKKNRPRQDTFVCQSCGYADHADTNAAKVLVRRHLSSMAHVVEDKSKKKKTQPKAASSKKSRKAA